MTLPRFPAVQSTRRLALARIGGWLLLLTVSLPAAGLPKITIAPDGRSFRQGTNQPFVVCGVNYFPSGTGWAPQLWKKFDAEAVRRDFALMKRLHINCVRVFLTYGSFFQQPDRLAEEGLAKFDKFLELAEAAGIYVHPAGPDHWEGRPDWTEGDMFAEERLLGARARFWELFAARYRRRNVILAYDLMNEPSVGWSGATMTARWNGWLEKNYAEESRLAAAWQIPAEKLKFGRIAVPPEKNRRGNLALLDFQHFREELADEWTRRQVAAIRQADPAALVTVGLIQWSVPTKLPGVRHYAAFNPQRQARFLDFLEVHFYPLASGLFHHESQEAAQLNLAYLESVVGEVAAAGKPVVLAEFGSIGGGTLTVRGKESGTEEQQADFCGKMIQTTAGLACGWLNWPLYDTPEANDCSQLTGLARPDGRWKKWGETFSALSRQLQRESPPARSRGARPSLPWADCITDTGAGKTYLEAYCKAFAADSAQNP